MVKVKLDGATKGYLPEDLETFAPASFSAGGAGAKRGSSSKRGSRSLARQGSFTQMVATTVAGALGLDRKSKTAAQTEQKDEEGADAPLRDARLETIAASPNSPPDGVRPDPLAARKGGANDKAVKTEI
jgi:hypothetical protein